ncbi:hypothetical protein [Flavobacterium anhuiense]|uniref:hypothetical protein n=1 Tax=Flavobacterium anhuiense TaxID=459526 RepID=UPI003D96ED2E
MESINERYIDRSHGDYNLLVKSGESVEIPAIDYYFDNVIIEENAHLIISENSENWVLIDCRQNFTLNGSITFRKFIADNSVRELMVDGVSYKHQFKIDNLGGNGGNSGFTEGNLKFNGAVGTANYGGGGGAGGFWSRRIGFSHGAHGSQNIGGVTSFSYGGNGLERKKYSNGGMLFLNIGHDFFIGSNNLIDMQGEDGENGLAGKEGSGSISSASYITGSGGGGGAPGGEGGVFYHRVAGNYSGAVLKTLVNGGKGGKGGIGGRYPESRFPSCNGLNGQDGERGRSGFVKVVR